MKKLSVFFAAVFVFVLFASIASADQILATKTKWAQVTEADTMGKGTQDSSAIILYTYGDAIIINKIEIQGWNKADQSDSDIELVFFELVYGDSGAIHSQTTYESGAKVVSSYQVSAYGDSDMYLCREFDYSTDFSGLAEGGKRLARNSSLVFAVQVKDGNYYSSLPGTTNLQATITVWYRMGSQAGVLKHTK